MKIISFINEQSVIRKILEHLNLWNRAEERAGPVRDGPVISVRDPPSQSTSQTSLEEVYDDGWPDFEKPYITYD